MARRFANDPFARLAKLARGSKPILVVLVGPNGAGKSTFFEEYLSPIGLPFINADIIARTLIEAGSPTGEETERLAATLAEKRREETIASRKSFITETVFSDPVGAKVTMLRDAQAAGYAIILVFVCVDSAELTELRIDTRVRLGGHDVPRAKIAGRFERMRKNVKAALAFADYGVLVDNSSYDEPLRPVAATAVGKTVFRNPPLPWWAEEVLPRS